MFKINTFYIFVPVNSLYFCIYNISLQRLFPDIDIIAKAITPSFYKHEIISSFSS